MRPHALAIVAITLTAIAACAGGEPPGALASDTNTANPTSLASTLPDSPPAFATETPPAIIVSPYVRPVVEDVQVRYLDSKPVQVELLIRATLPDQCPYELYTSDDRADHTIKVTLRGMHPMQACAATPQQIEYVLLLGRHLPEAERGLAAGQYQLTVNDFSMTFSVP